MSFPAPLSSSRARKKRARNRHVAFHPASLLRVQRRRIESIEKSGLEIVFPSVFGFMLLRGRNWKIYYREKGRNDEDEENSFLVFLAISLFRSIFTHKPAFEI